MEPTQNTIYRNNTVSVTAIAHYEERDKALLSTDISYEGILTCGGCGHGTHRHHHETPETGVSSLMCKNKSSFGLTV